jgi:hypothetical protein
MMQSARYLTSTIAYSISNWWSDKRIYCGHWCGLIPGLWGSVCSSEQAGSTRNSMEHTWRWKWNCPSAQLSAHHDNREIQTQTRRHGPHRKWRVQKFFYCCVYSLSGNVFTEPLPSIWKRDTHTDTQTDGRDLWSTQLRWAQFPWYTYQVS